MRQLHERRRQRQVNTNKQKIKTKGSRSKHTKQGSDDDHNDGDDDETLEMEMLYGPVFNLSCTCQNCDSPDVKIECSECNAAYLCSKKCEDEHKSNACKDIKQLGKKVLSDRRATFLAKLNGEKLALLVSEFDPQCCYHCKILFPTKELKFCAACTTARYCSKDCQVKDWVPKHRAQCLELRNLRERLFDFQENDIFFKKGFGSKTEAVAPEECDVLKRAVEASAKIGKNCSLRKKLDAIGEMSDINRTLRDYLIEK